MDLNDRILKLSGYRHYCSQILAILLLETLGEENPGLVRAMDGLSGGVGMTGGCCGCLTGGACLISYLTGRGADGEGPHPEHGSAVREFTDWFEEKMLSDFGSMDCRDVIGGNPAKRVEYCPQIIADTYEKCMEILSDKGLI